ncbi:DUF1579 family protein [Pseudarthrobacter scleromae]|jgi:hypothetical protein|uniref:DUF1579 domain-containing protein n=1 Tax=Pseudarthrobacter scleromae TaxID=158897 RepID=A0ABQ2CKI1_9MICC|nr:DUF1579 family protein [Pseudarthrobacter scleromae]GGI93824.1 hypothetical protein GCM10007175_34170 [Pseudarthrobacter scleromae]
MDRPRTDHGHPALANLLGRWRGTTRLESGPWGAERTVDAEMTFTLVAGGSAVVQSYRHTESDGSHFEGHGIFTVDPVRRDVLWYYVDSVNPAPDAPVRCTWHDGDLQVERHAGAGSIRHTLRVTGGVLFDVAELRRDDSAGTDLRDRSAADGATALYKPFMTSRYRRDPGVPAE